MRTLAQLWSEVGYPRVVERVCGTAGIVAERRRWIPQAQGRVLEVGFGSGLNLEHFDASRVTSLVGIDPSPALLARSAARQQHIPVERVRGAAEQLPFAAGRFDTVVFTYTLCSVADPAQALREAQRVLAPDGQLLVIEHGRSPRPRRARWQHRITPLWRAIAGNCHLDRDVVAEVERAGFAFTALDARHDPQAAPLSFAVSGLARPH